MTARILQIIVGLAGLCALVLGLVIWIANIDLTDIHMLFGLLVTLAPGDEHHRTHRPWTAHLGHGRDRLRHYRADLWRVAIHHARRSSALADPDAAHAGRHRRYRADGRTRRAL